MDENGCVVNSEMHQSAKFSKSIIMYALQKLWHERLLFNQNKNLKLILEQVVVFKNFNVACKQFLINFLRIQYKELKAYKKTKFKSLQIITAKLNRLYCV